MEGKLPTEQMPFVWGDFNARGWAGGGDASFYALDRDALAALPAKDGLLVFVWDHDEPGTILGWVAKLRNVALKDFSGWRAEPVAGSFYRGPKPAHLGDRLGA